jgi:hypothetical protein
MARYDDTFVDRFLKPWDRHDVDGALALDTYIEKAWKHEETEEIEDLAAELLRKAQEAQSIEDDLFCILYLAFRCGFKTALGNDRISISE